MLAEIVGEVVEALVEAAIGGAGAEGRGEVVAEFAELVEEGAGLVVVVGEDGDWVGEEAEAGDGIFFGIDDGALEANDVREEDAFFFGEVVVEVELELGEGGVDGGEFGVVLAVAAEDVGGEVDEARELAAGEGVVLDDDVGAEEFEGGLSPVGRRKDGAAGGKLESNEDGVDVEVDDAAGVGEGLIAAAAVVDAKVLEDTDGGGLVEGDLANGLGGSRHAQLR